MSKIHVQMTVPGLDEEEPEPVFTFEDRDPEDRARIIAKLGHIHREKLYAAEALRRSAS